MAIDGYIEATWGRIKLWVAKLETDNSRDVVRHRLSSGDEHPADDRGRGPGGVRCALLFDDMTGETETPIVRLLRLKAQVDALSQGGPTPIFQHPLGEAYPAKIGEFTYVIDEHSNVSDVVIEFIRDGAIEAVTPAGAGVAGVAGEGAVSAAADELDAALAAAGLEPTTITTDARASQATWTGGDSVSARNVFVDTANLTEQLGVMIDDLGLEDDLALWDVYVASIMLGDAIRAAAIAATSEVPAVFTFRVVQPIALLTLMARLYGGAEAEDRARQAEDLNDLRTPGWLEAGDELVLPVRAVAHLAEF